MSLFLDNNNSYIQINKDEYKDFGQPGDFNFANNYTLEFWFFTTTIPTNATSYIFLMTDRSSNTITLFFENDTFSLQTGGTRNQIPQINLSTWYHVALIYNNKEVSLYINGVMVVPPILSQFIFLPFLSMGGNATLGRYRAIPSMYIYNLQLLPYVKPITPSTSLPADTTPYSLILTTVGSQDVIAGGDLVTSYTISKLGPLASSSATTINVTTMSANLLPEGATIPVSTICFVGGTPVLTDQDGYVHIEKLVPGFHTIKGNQILAVTQSITPEKYLSFIPARSLAYDVPSADTVISLNHRIKIQDEWVKSFVIAYNLGGIYVKYNGEILYNVLLGDDNGNPIYGSMTVNNMEVETLDPENTMAKIHLVLKEVTPEQRIAIIQALNEYTRQHVKDSIDKYNLNPPDHTVS